jgi:hypothetical protein
MRVWRDFSGVERYGHLVGISCAPRRSRRGTGEESDRLRDNLTTILNHPQCTHLSRNKLRHWVWSPEIAR